MVSFLSEVFWCFATKIYCFQVIYVCHKKLAHIHMPSSNSKVKWCVTIAPFRVFYINIFKYDMTMMK